MHLLPYMHLLPLGLLLHKHKFVNLGWSVFLPGRTLSCICYCHSHHKLFKPWIFLLLTTFCSNTCMKNVAQKLSVAVDQLLRNRRMTNWTNTKILKFCATNVIFLDLLLDTTNMKGWFSCIYQCYLLSDHYSLNISTDQTKQTIPAHHISSYQNKDVTYL